MLNAGYKKAALKECERANEEYKKSYESTVNDCGKLYEKKEKAVDILKNFDKYVNSISNKPREIEKTISEISVRVQAFEKEIKDIKVEDKKNQKISQGVAGAGVLTGAGVAAFGPTAAMGIATTFGTASTGTAIATLSGVAQTNAALAWLGGGALTAGGGGMAAGQTFLAMCGPVGWAIGGAALIGGGMLANSKNKKIAQKAEQQTREIKNETDKIKRIDKLVCAEIKAIEPLNSGVLSILDELKKKKKNDYKKFTSKDKDELMQLLNSAESLSKRIGVKIS